MLMSNLPTAGRSHRGAVRGTNGDQYLVADLNRSITIHGSSLPVDDETQLVSGAAGQLLVVADGVSGQPGETVASQIGVGTVARYVLNAMPWFIGLNHDLNHGANHDHDDEQRDELLAALVEVERAIAAQARRTPEFDGMGTTVTMAYIMWPRLHVVNVGDSRCYLLRDAELQQLTRDQTAAQELVDRGTLSADQAATSPLSKILVSSAGQGLSSLRPDVQVVELRPGDRVLACTNGLTSQVDDRRIAALLGAATTPDDACEALVDAANEAGGTDNVTVVAAFGRPPIERTVEPEPVAVAH